TDVPPAPSTDEVTNPPAESTDEATPVSTEAPSDAETTATVIPETTDEAILSVPMIEVALTCKETGLEFEITNVGDDMLRSMAYTLTADGAIAEPSAEATPEATETFSVTEFTLLAGETLALEGGFGRPSLDVGGFTYQPEEDAPCLPPEPPVITVSAVCALDTGVTFTVANSGGLMTTEQGYSIAESDGSTVSGTFLLSENEETTVSGGYGQPTLTTGEIASTLETNCDAPAAISGIAWYDADGDGARGAAEYAIGGATVTLTNDDTGAYQTTVTVSDGSYSFAMLPTGAYSVTVDATTASGDYVPSSPADATIAIHAESGGTYVANFGFGAIPSASVSGSVWLETANYGVRDAGEMGIAGVMVDLVDQNGTVVAVAPVDGATGNYQFGPVVAGSYSVRLDQSTLFTPNGITFNSDDTPDYETPVMLVSNQTLTGIDFGVVGTF
ncbi:MAG: SdrD B-like domain-containing protein, partial [Chloroflexota bacterium]